MTCLSDDYTFLDENCRYKLYALSEYVYLKDKLSSDDLVYYSKNDLNIDFMYGDPTSGILSDNGEFIVVSGVGLSVYFFETRKTHYIEFFKDMYTFGLHQDIIGDEDTFQFAALGHINNDLYVFNVNILGFDSGEIKFEIVKSKVGNPLKIISLQKK